MSRKRPFHDKTYGDPKLKGAYRVVAELQKHAARCGDCTCRNECIVSAVCIFEEEKFEEEKEKKIFPSNSSISSILRPGLHKL